MLSEENQFPTIHAKISKTWTWVIKTIFGFAGIFIPISMVAMSVTAINSTKISLGITIFLIILTVLVIAFFVWLFITEMRKNKLEKITNVIIDHKGIHYFHKQNIVQSVLYTSLALNPDNDKDDVFVWVGDETNDGLRYYIDDEASKKVVMRGYFLECEFVIVNGNSLKRHFIKGIQTFRPDLKIDPRVFGFFWV